MRQQKLLEKIQLYQPEANVEMLNKAYLRAMLAHEKQKRASGEPYINHPHEVASILTDYRLDDVTIAAALLHDVIEDTSLTKDDIVKEFGRKIAFLVDGLTKFNKVNILNNKNHNATNFRKLFGAISKDIRVLFIKLVDRLHNMRTIDMMRLDKKKRIAEETVKVYAPLARLMGIEKINSELNERAFKILYPEQFEHIVKKLQENEIAGNDYMQYVTKMLEEKMYQNDIKVQITGRIKTPVSIWEKMKKKHVTLNKMSDICAFRLLVDDDINCYKILGIIHKSFPVIPGKFKDYISVPKKNSYRSLHTSVWGPHKQRMELQIRTYKMDAIAEMGIASHALYKIHGSDCSYNLEDNINVRRFSKILQDLQNNETNTADFFQNTLMELNSDEIFCFTPAGDIVALPRGSCALDFAYNVHTEVGTMADGCIVNNCEKSLNEILRNGDEVHIEVAKEKQSHFSYESFLKTGKARAAVRKRHAEENEQRNYEYGMKIVKRRSVRASVEISDKILQDTAKMLSYKGLKQAIGALGNNDIDRKYFFETLGKCLPKHIVSKEIITKLCTPAVDLNTGDMPITGGDGEKKLFFGDFVGAVPQDKIIGVDEGENGIAVYNVESKEFHRKVSENPAQKTYKLSWDVLDNSKVRYYAFMKLDFHDEVGALAKITKILSEKNVDISNLVLLRFDRLYKLRLDIGVFNQSHIDNAIEALKRLSIISNVERSFS